MAIVDGRVSIWEAIAGRAPGRPAGPADPDLWRCVAERLNPAKARPVLRKGIEHTVLATARGDRYVMLRSPDGGAACYVRLTPQEWELAQLFTGGHSVARLTAEFARITGRLAPDQVVRVVADLAANRMLEELPVDAFRPLERVRRKALPLRVGAGVLAAVRGRRIALAGVDPLVGALYRAGGRLLFTRPAAVAMALVAAAGLGLFGWSWVRAEHSVFLSGQSYVVGALVLLGLNVVALACHELGHALAVKHAGRTVPVAGFLVYFGVPSVFVDTSDVWMAGRRARIVTTAAGPASGLVLAGIMQLVGVLFPPVAPLAFKLSFAWYVNVLFNLNPFLALDGYYLLMDWLEIPNLRARGIAWVAGRFRRRAPKFAQLDGEGRLVALYGMLALLWTVIAANLAYRIYADRVSGLVLGLWRTGFLGRLLLLLVVAGIAAPLLYALTGWLGRTARRVHERLGERQSAVDLPKRLAVLRESPLARLNAKALDDIGRAATWFRPAAGQLLVRSGAAQPHVYVVAEGVLEGRRHGDPGGTVRQRVGAGGVVGLASALTGAPAALTWYSAGARLLAVPAPEVAAAVGPLGGPPPAERAEVEELLARSPEFAGRTEEDLLDLALRATPRHVTPGAEVALPGPHDGLVVAAGHLTLGDGRTAGAGVVVRPYEQDHRMVGTARSPLRLWMLPHPAAVPGADAARRRHGAAAGDTGTPVGRMPRYGVHPPAAYPPLAIAPQPPPADLDHGRDRRFERRLWWLVLLLAAFALLVSGSNMVPLPAYAEMPADRALVTADGGPIEIRPGGGRGYVLADGERAYVGAGDLLVSGARSRAMLLFRGGGTGVACAGTTLQIGTLVSDEGEPIRPRGALAMRGGRLLVDTRPDSGAFAAVRLAIGVPGNQVSTSSGDARFMVDHGATVVVSGDVRQNGTEIRSSAASLTCGDGTALPRSRNEPAPPEQPGAPSGPTGPTPPQDPGTANQPPPGGWTQPPAGSGPTRPPLPNPGTNNQALPPLPPPPVPPDPPPADDD